LATNLKTIITALNFAFLCLVAIAENVDRLI